MHWAGQLQAAGYSAIALSYFGAPGLPRRLVEVPVDQVSMAAAWLLERPEVVGDRVAVVGVSKGAELALVAASLTPRLIGAVVAYAPSAYVFEGIGFGRHTRLRSSWTLEGHPLAYVPYPRPMRPGVGIRGISLLPIYQAALEARLSIERAAIPVERSNAAILLVSGGRDKMWPAGLMAETLVRRLDAAGMTERVTHAHFEGAGHSFMPWQPHLPRWLSAAAAVANQARLAGVGVGLDLGGRPAANRAALHHAWRLTLEFLDASLESGR